MLVAVVGNLMNSGYGCRTLYMEWSYYFGMEGGIIQVGRQPKKSKRL